MSALLQAEHASVLLDLGDPAAALALALEGVKIAEAAGEPGSLAWCRFAAARATAFLGRKDDALLLLRQAAEVAEIRFMRPLKARCDQEMMHLR